MLLREKDRTRILAIAERTLPPEVEIWAYGSRVNGNAFDGSDLDLVLRGADLARVPFTAIAHFKEQLQHSNIPILIDVVDWARIPDSFHRNILAGYEVMRKAGVAQ